MIESQFKQEDRRLLRKKIQGLQKGFQAPVADTRGSGRRSVVNVSKRLDSGGKSGGIRAPKTIGDMVRYNRERAALESDRDAADKATRTDIAGFEARTNRDKSERNVDAVNRRTDIQAEHYDRADADAARRTDIYGEATDKELGIKADSVAADVAYKGKQGERIDSDIATADVIRASQEEQNRMRGLTNAAIESHASTTTTPLGRVQAFKGTTPAGMSEKDRAEIAIKRDANYIKWKATQPEGKGTPEQYRRQLEESRRAGQAPQGLGRPGQPRKTSKEEVLDSLFY